MSAQTADADSSTDPTNFDIPEEECHAKEDAIDDIEFERFWGATYEAKPATDLEMRLVLAVCGRLGLRRAELAHLQADWINWRERRIEIPHYFDCDLGRDYRACGACRRYARQQVDTHDGDVSFEEAIARSWTPKTPNAAREIPFGWCPRAELVLEEYFDRWDRWMYSAQAINRRVNGMIDLVDGRWSTGDDPGDDFYPHAARATAATHVASAGMSLMALQSMFGWSQASTAQLYVVQNADMAERELYLVNA